MDGGVERIFFGYMEILIQDTINSGIKTIFRA